METFNTEKILENVPAIKVIGKEHIGNIEFTGIEGGFGENKKSILAKDVAQIHEQSVGNINRLINNNRKWFEDGIDVIDLLNASEAFRNFAHQLGLDKSNRTQHIYLLSERGYSLLVKFMDDEKATRVYKQLLDNYFNMREAIKNNNPSLVQQRRLSIMEDNAATRKANMMYKIAMATSSETARQSLLAHAAKELTGEMTLPVMKHKEYTATQIGQKLGITSNKVGRIANQLGLKAEQPGQNEYGRWANSKSRSSDKEVPQWLYFDKGVKAIESAIK
ncbi:ORF6N domain-containing protein [Limosilactobacillus mucosae]|uniref:ORF6N domain-containing protein n=1 Tax=Limosilactobacillus mucosae TaxID=97478 RepID=UPI000887A698|nr:ORF6N domain-containing protein [Limosilactobacillus mucosae]MDC2841639.1 ORF6N domain-containing protein [Limosilactobacillus mucosae]SDN52847.1 ORF6N domain-containing protein [Limosilactobacillus mucosae]SEL12244.1 ORF6N domain-containing protein [Limosilactobacillus mucosae]SFK24756.1 ORF6N domain-containing protein [Limosilactobacillus mucosae]